MRKQHLPAPGRRAYRGRTLSAFLLVGRRHGADIPAANGDRGGAFGPQIAATAGAALIAATIIGVNVRNDEVRRFREAAPVLEEPTDAPAT